MERPISDLTQGRAAFTWSDFIQQPWSCGHRTVVMALALDGDDLAAASATLALLPCLSCRVALDQQRHAAQAAAELAALAAQQTPTGRICLECGEPEEGGGWLCPLSPDGEGEHVWGVEEPLTPAQAALLDRVAVHHEQGAAER